MGNSAHGIRALFIFRVAGAVAKNGQAALGGQIIGRQGP